MSILRSFVAIRPMVIILCKSRFGCTKKKRQNEKFYQNALVKLCILMIENYQLTFFSGCYQPIRDGIWLLYYYSCVLISKLDVIDFCCCQLLFACIHVHTHFALKNAPLLRIEIWSYQYVPFLEKVFLISRNEIIIKLQIYNPLQALILSSINQNITRYFFRV